MKDVAFHDSFSPTGATDLVTYDSGLFPILMVDSQIFPLTSCVMPAFTFGAGIQWIEAYEAARQHNRAIVGAAIQSVGAAGGWLAGGGHSAIASNYGLGTPNSPGETESHSPVVLQAWTTYWK